MIRKYSFFLKVVPAFLNKCHNKNRQLWVRHDCFVITPNLVTTLEQSYKKSFVDTFFKNSQDFLFSEFGGEIQFELARNSPIYIFQILIISNFCNILDYSLHLQGRASANLSEEKKEKRNHHVKIKKLLLDFLKKPSLENITDILFSIESTIFASNNDNGDGASKTKRLEETIIKKKKKRCFYLAKKRRKRYYHS